MEGWCEIYRRTFIHFEFVIDAGTLRGEDDGLRQYSEHVAATR